MNDQADDALNWAGLVLAGVIALVLTGVIVIAVTTSARHRTASVEQAQPRVADDGATLRLRFAPGSTALPAPASSALVRIADQVRADANLTVTIVGPAEPARAVQHALEANGLTADRIGVEPGAGQPDGQVVVRVR